MTRLNMPDPPRASEQGIAHHSGPLLGHRDSHTGLVRDVWVADEEVRVSSVPLELDDARWIDQPISMHT